MTIPCLPPEISNYIVDLLHNEPEMLKQCCLISKSWVPCIRKHLFYEILFECSDDLRTWKKAFPDPANTPAYYTYTLRVNCACITVADAEEGGWIQAFSNVVRLRAWNVSSVLTLICSLPRVEDLDIQGTWEEDDDDDDDEDATSEPPTLPPLIKTLVFSPAGGMERSARQLLDLLDGIRLRKFSGTWYYEKGSAVDNAVD